jgi:hypothetical protein
MVKSNPPTSTTSPHQTRSKSPKKKTVTTERRTSPRAKKNTKKVLVNRPLQIQDTAIGGGDPPSSSVAAAPPPPSVISARSKKTPVDKPPHIGEWMKDWLWVRCLWDEKPSVYPSPSS